MTYLLIYSFLCIAVISCKQKGETIIEMTDCFGDMDIEVNENPISDTSTTLSTSEQIDLIKLFNDNPEFVSNGFDFPVGKPNASGYYYAKKFKENNHLGDDWNGVGGGNSDLGDPIYATANGYISEVNDYEGGWGNVVRIIHLFDNKFYESLYAHCDTIFVTQDIFIKKGEQIAAIGNCNGTYLAHLHLEIRHQVGLEIGGEYAEDTTGYLDPTGFINKNRR